MAIADTIPGWKLIKEMWGDQNCIRAMNKVARCGPLLQRSINQADQGPGSGFLVTEAMQLGNQFSEGDGLTELFSRLPGDIKAAEVFLEKWGSVEKPEHRQILIQIQNIYAAFRGLQSLVDTTPPDDWASRLQRLQEFGRPSRDLGDLKVSRARNMVAVSRPSRPILSAAFLVISLALAFLFLNINVGLSDKGGIVGTQILRSGSSEDNVAHVLSYYQSIGFGWLCISAFCLARVIRGFRR